MTDNLINVTTTSIRDPDFTYFPDVLNYNTQQLESSIQDAFTFFNERFGLDFSQATPDSNGRRFFQNCFFEGLRAPINIVSYSVVNRWLLNGIIGSNNCYVDLEGGFRVGFVGNQTVRGTYGGDRGRTLSPRHELIYIFIKVDVCQQSPLVIQCQSITPTFSDDDGFSGRNLECFHQFLGRGRLQGSFGLLLTDDPNIRRVVSRFVINFPDSL